MPNRPASPPAGDVQSWRNVSDLLSIWALCDRAICRKARGCRGEGCVRRYSPLVPEIARIWVAALFACKEAGASFDEAVERLAAEGLQDAYLGWIEAARRSAGRGRPRPVAPPK